MKNDTNVSWINSIQTRVALITMFLALLIMGGAMAFNALQTKSKLANELVTLTEMTADRLATHLAAPLWDLDKDQIDMILEAEMQEQRVFSLIVNDSDGKTLFTGAIRDNNWQSTPYRGQGFRISGMQSSQRDILNGEDKVGSITVFLSGKFMTAELQAGYTAIAIQLTVLALAIFLTMFLAIRKIVISPIRKLSQAADAMSKGDFDSQIGIAGKDEIGQVATSMERMKSSLKIAMSKIQLAAS